MKRAHVFFTLVAAGVLITSPRAVSHESACHAGYYRLDDGRGIDVASSGEDSLRWRAPDGTSGALERGTDGRWISTRGWTLRADGVRVSFGDCAAGEIDFAGTRGHRVAFETANTRFKSGGVELAGRLVMPPGKGRVPVIVLVHGSEDTSAIQSYSLQRLFPGEGVGAFVYDKRGTGESAGTYTHNYPELAADAAAAVGEARRLAGARAGRVGFQGSSQGGWVAPRAATLTKVDFVIVGYGLAVSPFDEDNEAVALDMTRHGFGDAEIRKALEVASAAQAVARSNFQSGYEGLDAMRTTYSQEPWFRHVRGNATGIIYGMSQADLRAQGPVLFHGIIPDYGPMPVLRKLNTPQLWILGGQDIDAPPAETIRRLRGLQEDGKPISLVVYPLAEHGMYEFETVANEERLSTRQPSTWMPLMVEFARRGKIGPRYEGAQVYR